MGLLPRLVKNDADGQDNLMHDIITAWNIFITILFANHFAIDFNECSTYFVLSELSINGYYRLDEMSIDAAGKIVATGRVELP
eukprot:UN16523